MKYSNKLSGFASLAEVSRAKSELRHAVMSGMESLGQGKDENEPTLKQILTALSKVAFKPNDQSSIRAVFCQTHPSNSKNT